uniref:AP2/ERF domain-containing protein n=1 Tax=Macrostomum lignano TaxID=282301 RepID=A0A1I8F597_9PLAT
MLASDGNKLELIRPKDSSRLLIPVWAPWQRWRFEAAGHRVADRKSGTSDEPPEFTIEMHMRKAEHARPPDVDKKIAIGERLKHKREAGDYLSWHAGHQSNLFTSFYVTNHQSRTRSAAHPRGVLVRRHRVSNWAGTRWFIVDNHQVQHGRMAFQGPRKLKAELDAAVEYASRCKHQLSMVLQSLHLSGSFHPPLGIGAKQTDSFQTSELSRGPPTSGEIAEPVRRQVLLSLGQQRRLRWAAQAATLQRQRPLNSAENEQAAAAATAAAAAADEELSPADGIEAIIAQPQPPPPMKTTLSPSKSTSSSGVASRHRRFTDTRRRHLTLSVD